MRGSVTKVERKTKSNGWRVRVEVPSYGGGREWRSRTFETKKKAEEWQAKINHEINQGEYVKTKNPSLQENPPFAAPGGQ